MKLINFIDLCIKFVNFIIIIKFYDDEKIT